MRMTYVVTTNSPKVNGNTVTALNNAASLHEKKTMECVKAAIGRFFGVNADIVDKQGLIKYVPGSPYSKMIHATNGKEIVRISSMQLEELDNSIQLTTAYQTWDGKK